MNDLTRVNDELTQGFFFMEFPFEIRKYVNFFIHSCGIKAINSPLIKFLAN